MKINTDVTLLIKQYEDKIVKLKTYLEKLPQEHIYTHKRKNKYIYCLRSRDAQGKLHEKYLTTEQGKYIKECCEQFYVRKLIFAIEKELNALRIFAEKYKPNEKFAAWEKLPEAYKQFIKPLFKSNEQICLEWEKASFEGNTFPLVEGARYITKKGECVRSRIELIVANILYDLKIPYRYECKLMLPSGAVWPDFTIMNPKTLEVYYLEIFGMMDNPEYEMSAFKKIAKYAASEYYSNLIMFFDHKNAPISPEDIKRTLEKLFC